MSMNAVLLYKPPLRLPRAKCRGPGSDDFSPKPGPGRTPYGAAGTAADSGCHAAQFCVLVTAVTAGTPDSTTVAVPLEVAFWLSVSVAVPPPVVTFVPDGNAVLFAPTLPPPTSPPASGMSAG